MGVVGSSVLTDSGIVAAVKQVVVPNWISDAPALLMGSILQFASSLLCTLKEWFVAWSHLRCRIAVRLSSWCYPGAGLVYLVTSSGKERRIPVLAVVSR